MTTIWLALYSLAFAVMAGARPDPAERAKRAGITLGLPSTNEDRRSAAERAERDVRTGGL